MGPQARHVVTTCRCVVMTQLSLPGTPARACEQSDAPDGSSDEFYTPKWILDTLPRIDLDPCSPPHRPVPAARHFVLPVDGLSEPWGGTVFCNPPYSRGSLPDWMRKCCRSAVDGCEVIALVPARPGSEYWHAWIWPVASVGFLRGRVTFDDAHGRTDTAGTFDSALVVWGSRALAHMRESTRALGVRWVRWVRWMP